MVETASRKRIRWASVGLSLLLVLCLRGQEPAPRIDTQNALSLVRRLTSPAMEGRRSGTRGGALAAEFIARKFREYGLEPGGDNGSYFQSYTFPMFDFVGPNKLTLLRSGQVTSFRYGSDFQIENLSGGGHAEGEVIFVGYGLSFQAFDEYAPVDVRGKIVVALQGVPPRASRQWPLDAGWDRAKAKQAAAHGARALLLVPDPKKGKQLTPERVWAFEKEDWQPNLIVARIDVNVATDLFADSDQRLDILKGEIDHSLIPRSMALRGSMLRIEAGVTVHPAMKTASVLAILRGSDPELKNEVILVGGHYDHGGRDPTGDIYPGAEDDASGTALVLEIARTLAAHRNRPKRSVLFAAWAAEEQNYSGHDYYVKHPRFPLDRTVANFWLDNTGIGDGRFLVYSGKEFPEIYSYISERVGAALREKADPRFYPTTPFSKYGVPSFFPEANAPQPFNHTPWDRPSVLSLNALGTIGQYTLEATVALANAPAGFIESDRLSRLAVRSTPIFTLTPLSLQVMRSSKDSLFGHQAQQNGPVVFFGLFDLEASSPLDNLVYFHALRDGSGRKVAVISGSNFPRSFGGESDSGVVLTADALSLLRHPEWVPILRQQGLGAVIIRGQDGKLPSALATSDGAIKPEAAGVLNDFPFLIQNLAPSAAKKLLPRTMPVVLMDSSEAGGSITRYDPEQLRSLAESGALLEIRFPCSAETRNNETAERVAREIVRMKEVVGVSHILLGPEISQNSPATSLQSVVEALLAKGWELNEIQRILGGNLANLWSETASH